MNKNMNKLALITLLISFSVSCSSGTQNKSMKFDQAKILYQNNQPYRAKALLEEILTENPYNEEAIKQLFKVSRHIHNISETTQIILLKLSLMKHSNR